MATVNRALDSPAVMPELHTGDRMSRAEFHRIYKRMPRAFKAELIGGIVYVASPLKRKHGTHHLRLGGLFSTYELETPGVEAGDNTTILLGKKGEPQPDLFLRILPECGGQSHTTADDYVRCAELLAEIAHSSRAIDLHAKREDYQRNGVWEYLVWCLRERQLRWFDLRSDRELEPAADGIIRVRSFPGLWIDVAALVSKNRRLLDVLGHGLETPEHAAFIRALADARAATGGRRSRSRPSRRGRGKGQ